MLGAWIDNEPMTRQIKRFFAAIVLAAAPCAVSAQIASRPAADWVKVLDNPERIAAMRVPDVVAALNLRQGDVVADLGAGSGPFVVAFANAVSPAGKVYAVEVDKDFFPFIEARAKAAGTPHVRTVLGEFTDPKLPASDVDVAFMHDVLHHIEKRPDYLRNLVKYLKPSARIAIIDYNAASSPHRDDPSMQVTSEQATAWLSALGFKPVETVKLFSDKWFVIFRR